MELRKVQLTGGTSMTVTLPKSWTEKVRLKAGDVVGCTEQSDGSLAVHAHARGEREIQRYTVDVSDGEPDYLFRKIVAAYLTGYDVVVVTSRKPLPPAARRTIQTAVRRIIGLEIVEEGPDSVTLQDFLDPREYHMDKALRRMGMLTQAMQEEALLALASPGAEAAPPAGERDDEVDRLYWLVNKQFHAMLRDVTYAARMDLSPSQGLNFLLVARLLERTADHADRIGREAVAVPRTRATAAMMSRVEKAGRRAADLFREAFQTFLRGDAKRANALIGEADEFLASHARLLKDAAALGGETVSHLVFVLDSIARTAAYAADVCEIAINHKVATPAPA